MRECGDPGDGETPTILGDRCEMPAMLAPPFSGVRWLGLRSNPISVLCMAAGDLVYPATEWGEILCDPWMWPSGVVLWPVPVAVRPTPPGSVSKLFRRISLPRSSSVEANPSSASKPVERVCQCLFGDSFRRVISESWTETQSHVYKITNTRL